MLDQSATLDRLFHALADPSRRAMVERLSQGPATVSELAEPLSMTLAAVVQHVQVLESSGIVRSEKIGRSRTCTLEADALLSAETWLTRRRTSWVRRLDRLGEFLADLPDEMHAVAADELGRAAASNPSNDEPEAPEAPEAPDETGTVIGPARPSASARTDRQNRPTTKRRTTHD